MIQITPAASIAVHGGAGGDLSDSDGCLHAATVAQRELAQGSDALSAAVAALVSMEDDGRFNAGRGAILGLDGHTIDMDAAVMDSLGRLGSVACIRRVKNPILVARDVAASPHRMLCGEGATHFARVGGHADFYQPTDKARQAHRAMLDCMASDPGPIGMLWNFERPPPSARQYACDTVGAVVRSPGGQFAVAASTGGGAPSPQGRVGDTPLVGCGFYAGQHGAVTVTGTGEQIIPHLLAHTVYQWIAQGLALEQALTRALDLFDSTSALGIIAVTSTLTGSASHHDMPHVVL